MIKKFEKADWQSMDIVESNIEQLKELFPDVFAEGQINFDRLQEVLGNYVVTDEDHYNFTWHGKRAAGRLAQTPSTGTLRPCPQESVDWDKTQNLFIEGDNLEVLKLLQKSYHRQIKMIYIDPPYNTGGDFIYADDFKDGVKSYLSITGQLDEEGKKKGTNSSATGRYHTNWLNMMYPRLKMARNLLKDEGVIAVHIDENEYVNLEKLLSEVFGEENSLGSIVWDKRNPKGEVAGVAQQHEMISFFCKNKSKFSEVDYFNRKKENAALMLKKADEFIMKNGGVNEKSREAYKTWCKDQKNNLSGGEKAYSLIDNHGKVYRPVSMAAPDKPETRSHRPLIHPVTGKPCPTPQKGWRFPDKSMDNLLAESRVLFGSDETTQPQQKYLLEENMREAVPSLLYFGGSDDALGLPFDNPKPVYVVARVIESICREDKDIILDFFAGSATTAHATMHLNSDDNKNRRFIMVQLPEATDEKSDAHKAGFKNISDLSKERIRRAARKVKDENPLFGGDLGFKVLKLDTSNIKTWEAGFDTLKDDLIAAADYIKQDRSSDDIVFELLLKYGLDLTVPIETRMIAGKKAYSIGMGALVVCLDNDVPMETVNGIGALKEELKPEIMRVVFKDSGFKDDVVKTNALQTLKRFGIEDIKSL